MVLGPLLPILGIGTLVVGALLFWAAVQNWIADLLHRASAHLGALVHAAQSALVILDRVIVNGQRVFLLTGRVVFRDMQTRERVAVEERRQVCREDLPADVLARLEQGQTLQYELSIGSMKIQQKHEPTYRLVVRRAE
jgi:hypothetical protein